MDVDRKRRDRRQAIEKIVPIVGAGAFLFTRFSTPHCENDELMNKKNSSIGKILTFALALTGAFLFSTAQAADGFRIMSYNVRNGAGLDNKTDYARTCDVFNREAPDVVAIQELDCKTKRSNGADVLGEFAKLTDMTPSYGPAIEFQGGQYGIGILSKEKPIAVNYYPLPGSEEERCLLVVEFEKFVFCCTHWSLTKKDRATSAQIVTEKMKEQKKPVIICGDFNAGVDEDSIKEIKKDWTALNDDESKTFPADEPTVHIDYIFGADPTGKISPEDWKKAVKETYVVEEKIASDHRPVVVVLDPELL